MSRGSHERLEVEVLYHLRVLADLLRRLRQSRTVEEWAELPSGPSAGVLAGSDPGKAAHPAVQSALAIIHATYNTGLSLDSVAREVFVSMPYLSSLFKQELGINFLDYLHRYRIEQSKLLLKNHMKVCAVARMVGYQEERQFSKTFKKWTGLTPTQYQKSGSINTR